MRLFLQSLILVLALALIYVVAQGLGLTKGFNKKKENKRILVINDFEDPSMDLDWATGGYVKMETSTDNLTHGKRSALATFLLQSQFYPTPTLGPNAPPTATPEPPTPTPNPKVKVVPTSQPRGKASPTPVAVVVPSTPPPPSSWQPTLTLDTESPTKLRVYDWSEYGTLNLDVFNPQDLPVTWHMKVADAKSFTYDSWGVLSPKKVSNLAVTFTDLTAQRLDLTNMRSIQFWVDTNGWTTPPLVYLDYLRLEGDLTPVGNKKK
jgi:hypothetical protein